MFIERETLDDAETNYQLKGNMSTLTSSSKTAPHFQHRSVRSHCITKAMLIFCTIYAS